MIDYTRKTTYDIQKRNMTFGGTPKQKKYRYKLFYYIIRMYQKAKRPMQKMNRPRPIQKKFSLIINKK